MFRNRLLLLLALASSAVLPACSGLDSNDDDLPAPAIFDATDAVPCGTAGTFTVTLDPLRVHAVENNPVGTLAYVDRVEVGGVASGLAAGQSVYGILIDDSLDCPITSSTELTTVAADGSFTLTLRISTTAGQLIDRFRVVAMVGPSGASASCGGAGDCVELLVGGVSTPPAGISNAIGVRL